MRIVVLLIWAASVFGCSSAEKNPNSADRSPSGDSVALRYARGFSILKDSGCTWIEVKTPYQGANQPLRYLLVPRGTPAPDHSRDTKVIQIPVTTIVCTSTTHIPLLEYLGVGESLSGFPTPDYISSEFTRLRIDDGLVKDVGIDKGLNIELLSSLRPDVVMGYTMTPDYGQFRKIEEMGMPVVINAEYLEKHPLGRAEWIKFVAAFYGREERADSVFRAIEKNYLATKALAENSDKKPTILSGIMYGDAWFLPGGRNYAATMLKDAGYRYLWEHDTTSGFLELSLETVLSVGHGADFWIGVGPFQSRSAMSAADNRYERFEAFQKKQVYSYDARKGAKGGNEYLELGYLRPDLILKDLVKIAHPQLLPEHDLFFHRRLD